MRTKGTKYDVIEKLPDDAVPVSEYSRETGYAVGYIYIKYERALSKKASIGYEIKCFKGSNFIIPIKEI